MLTEDDYFEMVNELDQRLSAPDPDEDIRKIVRQETDKRVMALLALGAFIWLTEKYGWIGGASVLGIVISAFIFRAWHNDMDPKHDRHLVTVNAAELVRLTIIAEIAAAGKNAWILTQKQYATDTRKIIEDENEYWDCFWERTYKAAVELEKMSPKEQRNLLVLAANAAREPLIQAKTMAKRNKAQLVSWAYNAFYLVKWNMR